MRRDTEKYLVPFGESGCSDGFTSSGWYVFFFRFPTVAAALTTARWSTCVGGKARRISEAGDAPVFST